MVSCVRCARSQKECRLSSLSKECSECIRSGRNCQPAEPVVHFDGIDHAMAKLEKEEEETEAAMDAAMELLSSKKQKLKRIRAQRRFLKDREQKLFDRGLSDVEELERMEEMEKAKEVETSLGSNPAVNDSGDLFALSPGTLSWIENSFGGTLPASQDN